MGPCQGGVQCCTVAVPLCRSVAVDGLVLTHSPLRYQCTVIACYSGALGARDETHAGCERI